MVISELIKELEALKEKHGDVVVVTSDPDFMMPTVRDCTPLIKFEKKGVIVKEGPGLKNEKDDAIVIY